MRFVRVPFETRGLYGRGLVRFGRTRGPGEGGRVEATELMKRIAFVIRAAHGGIQERNVERGIVPDQNRALTIVFAQRAGESAMKM